MKLTLVSFYSYRKGIMLDLFKIQCEKDDNSMIDAIFDFVIIGFVAICFANFGQAIATNNLKEVIFSFSNITLISTSWYAYIFYSTRYQRRTPFHVFLMWVTLTFTVVYGVGIKASYLSESVLSNHFISIGYMLSRIPIVAIFMFIDISNKSKEVSALVRWKYISRIVAILLVTLNLLIGFVSVKYLFVAVALIEVFGNIFQVRSRYMNKLPQIDFDYSMNRFTKLNSLYIGCILIASINYYSTYVSKLNTIFLIEHLVATVALGFLLWISFYQRILKFDLKYNAKAIVLFSTSGILIDIGISILGSMMLFAKDIINVKPQYVYLAMIFIVFGKLTFLYVAYFKQSRMKIKYYKLYEYLVYLGVLILFMIFVSENAYIALLVSFIILILMIVNYYIQEYLMKIQKNEKKL